MLSCKPPPRQELYRKKPEDGRHKERVTVNLQRQVAAEFGFQFHPRLVSKTKNSKMYEITKI